MPAILRDPRDRLDVALSLLPPLAVAVLPSPATVALGVFWLGNTVAHHAVHRRFCRGARLERAWSAWLTLLLGVPQRLWRQRHLAHHAGRPWQLRKERQLAAEALLLLLAWSIAALAAPAWLVGVYAPGLAGGLALALAHGWFEHAGGTTSCHARWWNVPLLNDGLHVEHHRAPHRPWRDLRALACVRTSVLPPLLRWLRWLRPEAGLDALERLVLRWPRLRQRVLAAHRRALAAVLADVPEPARIVVVGGGLFPRSALLLRERWPRARLEVLDADAAHLRTARAHLPDGVGLRHGTFAAGDVLDADLVVLPLALRGARALAIAEPPAPLLLVHDWAWRRPDRGTIVAWWLFKRVYVVRSVPAPAVQPA